MFNMATYMFLSTEIETIDTLIIICVLLLFTLGTSWNDMLKISFPNVCNKYIAQSNEKYIYFIY